MANELTLHADAALRAILRDLREGRFCDGQTAAYRRGQIDLITIYMTPTPKLLAEVQTAAAVFSERARKVDDEFQQRLMRAALRPSAEAA